MSKFYSDSKPEQWRVTLIMPLTHANKSWVSPAMLEERIFAIAGGFTRHRASGEYRADSGANIREPVVVYTIIVDDPRRIDDQRRVAQTVAEMYGQECVYFEVTPTHVEFVRPRKVDAVTGR